MVLFTITSLLFCFGILASAWDGNNIESVKEYVAYVASKEGVDVQTALSIAKCESRFNKDAIHSTEKEYSVGIFQINLKAHSSILKEEALNPFLNINWAIDQMAQGKFYMWTCWNQA